MFNLLRKMHRFNTKTHFFGNLKTFGNELIPNIKLQLFITTHPLSSQESKAVRSLHQRAVPREAIRDKSLLIFWHCQKGLTPPTPCVYAHLWDTFFSSWKRATKNVHNVQTQAEKVPKKFWIVVRSPLPPTLGKCLNPSRKKCLKQFGFWFPNSKFKQIFSSDGFLMAMNYLIPSL